MANRYEFNVEDINEVKVISKDGSYTTIFNRKYSEEGYPSTSFVQSYFAPADESEEGIVKLMCPRCEGWNTVQADFYNCDEFEFECRHCEDDYEDYVEENDMIKYIMALMEEETFRNIELIINDTVII